MAVAQGPYRPAGLMVDFELVPGSASGFTFQMGQTYVITNSLAYLGPGQIVFQPGCTIKYTNNATMLVYGTLSFPNTLQTPVFTSVQDNAFGETLSANSTNNPTLANTALWVYYVNFSTLVQNARFRWAQTAVRYDANPGVNVTHYVLNSLLEHCQTGVRNDMPDGMVSLSGVEMHAVTGPVSGPYQGSYTAPLFYTEKSFAGLESTGRAVADTMGAIGNTKFLAVTTAGKIAFFDRITGQRVEERLLNQFFGVPRVADPRVWFDNLDPQQARWLVSGMYTDSDLGQYKLLLKVSYGDNPTLNDGYWAPTYEIPFPEAIDFPTLGVDFNGVYLSVQLKTGGENHGFRIQAFRKPDVYTDPDYRNRLPPLLAVTPQELETWCIQPACNFDDPQSAGGYAWFVAKGPREGNLGGTIRYRRVRWNGANLEWVGNWETVYGAYRDYYDIFQDDPLTAPQTVALGDMGSRLMMAMIRSGSLWTCHHVGLGAGGTWSGGTVTRSAIQWFKLQVSSSGLGYQAHGRIYDAAWSNPYWYHFPSLGCAAPGNVVVGFSGSRTGEYIGAFWQGRRWNGTWMSRPVLLQAGRSSYNGNRWGDYSATTLDPTDSSFWTVQMYANPDPDGLWGTWITQVKVSP